LWQHPEPDRPVDCGSRREEFCERCIHHLVCLMPAAFWRNSQMAACLR